VHRSGLQETQSGGHAALSRIELQIVQKLCDGYQSKEIAAMLGKSKATIEGYVRLLYAKLNARSRAQVVARAFALGLLDDAPPNGQLESRQIS